VKLSAFRAGLRDVVSLALGVFVIVHQELTGGANWFSWTTGAMFILGPGVIGARELIRGSMAIAGTHGSSSESDLSHSEASSSSTSS